VGWAALETRPFVFFPARLSVFPTLLTSPNAARFRVLAAVVPLIVDFFVWRAALAGSESSSTLRAAACALVRRVVPLFSSFSLPARRVRVARACYSS
jgi:hypothetical protein